MNGRIILATGPMFSGKTSWLIKNLAKRKPSEKLVLKFVFDNRYKTTSINSHDGTSLEAEPIENESDILGLLKEKPNLKVLGIDELQFFKPKVAQLLSELRSQNIDVFTSGLNVDFNNKKWETTEEIRKIADTVLLFKSVCVLCGNRNATITYRKSSSTDRILIGGSELYEPLCEKDYTLKKSDKH